jgi:chromosome partitioning protein
VLCSGAIGTGQYWSADVRVIAVVNYKGGVGKTTFTANMGAELARRGKHVLLVDLDPQCSLTQCFYAADDYQFRIRQNRTLKLWFDTFVDGQPRASLANFIDTPREVNAAIQQHSHGRLDLIASDVLLFQLDLDAARAAAHSADVDRVLFLRRRALLDALSTAGLPAYDYVLLDCPPSFGLLTQAALVACRDVIMPAKADYLSTVGLDTLFFSIHGFREDYATMVEKYGGKHAGGAFNPGEYLVLYTMVRFRFQRPEPGHQYYMDQVKKVLKLEAFQSVIRQSEAAFGNIGAHLVPPVLRLKPSDQIHEELSALTDEFLARFPSTKGSVAAA